MGKKKIEKLVDEFLANQPNTYSVFWRNDLVNSVEVVENKKETITDKKLNQAEKLRRELSCRLCIETTHDKKFRKMTDFFENSLRRRFYVVLSDIDIECIIGEATDQWRLKFNAIESKKSKNPEFAFLKLMVRNALSEYKKKYNIQNVPLENVEYYLEDTKDYFDDEIERNAREEKEDLDQEFIREKGIKSLPIKFGDKLYPNSAFNEIFRYYSITEKVEYTSDVHQRKAKIVYGDGKPDYIEIIEPKLKLEYWHDRQAFSVIHQELIEDSENFELLNINNTADYYQRRWEILRSAETIRWMELAVSKIRESNEKKTLDLLKIKKNDEEGRLKIVKAPALGAVLVCPDGRFFTCFRGEIDETILEDGRVRDITWDKHCEYSLFVEVVKEENIHLLKGGILYVTLEPCNKRTPIKSSSGQLKIPCAVRCVEAGLKKIYLGSFDYNKRVLGKGREILETGKYKFELVNGNHKEFDLDENGKLIKRKNEEIEGAKRLEAYFISKSYPLISSDDNQRVYKIGECVEVDYFDRELMLEVYNFNSGFQRKHKPEVFSNK